MNSDPGASDRNESAGFRASRGSKNETDRQYASDRTQGNLELVRSRSEDTRKHEHAAFVLPVFGALLLLPPLIDLFGASPRLGGIPLKIAYLFLVWIVLILGAVMVSAHMPALEKKPPELPPAGGG